MERLVVLYVQSVTTARAPRHTRARDARRRAGARGDARSTRSSSSPARPASPSRAAARARAEDVRAMARPADARDAASSAVLAVLRAPCDAYAKSFDGETAASLRAGARRALEAQCARAGGDETRSDACGDARDGGGRRARDDARRGDGIL